MPDQILAAPPLIQLLPDVTGKIADVVRALDPPPARETRMGNLSLILYFSMLFKLHIYLKFIDMRDMQRA